MGLVTRLIGGVALIPPETKIPVHTFYSALSEAKDGVIVKAAIVAHWSLDAAEEIELDALIAKYVSVPLADKEHFLEVVHRILILAEGGFAGYTTPAELNARISAF